MRVGNFRDAAGLVRRALASRDPVAYSALFRYALRTVNLPFDLLLSAVERGLLRREIERPRLPVLLVVGGSRTGTTLTSQILARHLEVSTTTNLVEVFPRSPIAASRLFRALHNRPEPTREYRSYYGKTRRFRDPCDAFDIWNRWLGADRYRPVDRISTQAAAEMRRFFAVWTSLAGRPVLNKNNRNTGAMGAIAAALPAVRFVVVRRDPLYAAQSLLLAREAAQGDRAAAWGFAAVANGRDPVEAVAAQIAEVARTLEREEAKVDESRLFRVDYERLCADPQSIVRAIGERFGIAHDVAGLAPLWPARRRRLPTAEFERLAAAVALRAGALRAPVGP